MATKTTKAPKVYNVNEMRRVILAARKDGNRRVITAGFCKEHGVTEGFYAEYEGRMTELQNAVCEFVRMKHYNSQDIQNIGGVDAWQAACHDSRERIFTAWKHMLECGEKEKFIKQLHVNPNDIDSLVGYGEMFMNMNNTDQGAEKQIACTQSAAFRKKVETLIGIRIDDVSVMADDERDFLLKERKLSNSINSATSAQKRAQAELNDIKALKKVLTAPEYQAKLNDTIMEKEETIASCKAKITKATKDLATLRADRKKELKGQSKKAAA